MSASSTTDDGSSSSCNYTIFVKTGDYSGASTNDSIYIILVNKEGQRSKDIILDCEGRNDLQKGKTDDFPVENLSNFGEVSEIEVWRDEFFTNSWFCEYIKVQDNVNKNAYVFPINRWLLKNFRMVFQLYDSMLPQNDKYGEQRRLELDSKRSSYAYAPQVPGIPCQVINLPPDEEFSNSYKYKFIFKEGAINTIAEEVLNRATSNWESLDELVNVYKGPYPIPMGVYNWTSDFEFGKQRLLGCNPGMIRLCTKIPEKFGVTNEMLRPFLEGLTIEEAIRNKRLFIVDLQILKDLQCTDLSKQVCCPIALFFINKFFDLLPVAIQLFQEKADDNPVFLPSDPEYTWMLAKMWYNNADASYHQSATHLGFTHLLVESIAAATNRNLSRSHPIFRLLAPHFLYIMAINKFALETLVNEGGWVDETMTIGRVGMFEIIRRRFKTWQMDVDGTFPKELESRGVGDPNILPKYYYRDDGLLLWDAVYKYVSTVVNAHYDTPEKVSGDYEIQAWNKALSSSVDVGGCGIQGVPGDGCFKSADEIIQTVTATIFTSSVIHASVNFGQYDEYAFPPNYPATVDGKPPTNKDARTEDDILTALPNKEQTLSVMNITKVLSTKATNGLGDFEVDYQYDPVGTGAIQEFQKDLNNIAKVIKKRNSTRSTKYAVLSPENIPNAISI